MPTPHVFISYARSDRRSVLRLNAALLESGRDGWVDWEDIPLADNYVREIEGADALLFLLSDDSIASTIARQKLDHAVRHRKRLVPVIVRDFDRGAVPDALGLPQWTFLREDDDFAANFAKLLMNSTPTSTGSARTPACSSGRSNGKATAGKRVCSSAGVSGNPDRLRVHFESDNGVYV
ncbi:MAG: hypothetical protein BGO49_20085 [Planctomycetales bacterium 71-10]|nr:MAG: hypothetical protein BGO49_20085 [Planctomycetales bacterium 71-10]